MTQPQLNARIPFVFGLFLIALMALGCTPKEVVPQAPMPAGASFQGRWYTNPYEEMVLNQDGNSVSGTFEYRDGGSIAGRVEGGVLLFDWVQNGDLSRGRRESRGKGYFLMTGDGTTFEGKWGYEDSRTNGGAWNGEKLLVDYTE